MVVEIAYKVFAPEKLGNFPGRNFIVLLFLLHPSFVSFQSYKQINAYIATQGKNGGCQK